MLARISFTLVPLLAPLICGVPTEPITPDQARSAAARFVHALYRVTPQASSGRVTRADVANWRQYRVDFPSLKGMFIAIDLVDGSVSAAWDNRTSAKRRKGVSRSGRYLLATASAATKYMDALAKRIGVPKGWKRVTEDYYRDHTPGRGDSDQSASAYACYAPRPNGYPFLNCGPKMAIQIDPFDGTLLYYLFVNHTRVGAVDVRVTPAQPIATATRAVVLPNEHRRHVVAGKPKLGWAVPNAGLGSPLPDETAKPPFKATLAYEIHFNDYITGGRKLSESWVWVDAKTGKVLGGNGTK